MAHELSSRLRTDRDTVLRKSAVLYVKYTKYVIFYRYSGTFLHVKN